MGADTRASRPADAHAAAWLAAVCLAALAYALLTLALSLTRLYTAKVATVDRSGPRRRLDALRARYEAGT